MAKPASNARKLLERLRSNEPAGAMAAELGLREGEIALARELVRHIGEHQADAAGRLPDALAQAVVEAAVQIEHGPFLKAVAESGSKAASSAAKRGLAILRSKGIEIELAPAGEAVFKPEALSAEELPCFLSTCDSDGGRILFVPTPLRGGGVQLLSVLFSDERGILEVEEGELSRKNFRRLPQQMAGAGRDRGPTLFEIARPRAQAYIARARSLSGGLGLDAESRLAPLSGDPAQAESPLASAPPLAPEAEAERVQESAALFREWELRGWIPGEEPLQQLSLKLQEVATSQLYLDAAQRRAQSAHEVETAVDQWFDGRRRQLWAGRLFELAEAFTAAGRTRAGEIAAATARALRSEARASTLPFCRQLFERYLERPAHEDAPAAAQESSPGGLIVPAGAEEPRP